MKQKRGRISLVGVLLRNSIQFAKQRKAQLTAFMLLGLVILAIFSFMYYISGSLKQAKIEKEIDLIAEKITETNILRQYVTLCLKNSVEDGLVLAGKQGGNIYYEQQYL